MLRSRSSHTYLLVVFLIAVVLIAYKFRFLSLPYYWDEAWPYATGVRLMEHRGLSLLPGAIPPEVARGHPLMFHCLAAAWMKVFGTSLIAGHCFALGISVSLLFAVYGFCYTFFSERVGMVAVLLLAVQPVFITQSAFLLPEMLMALWTMLCLYTWLANRRMLLFICCTAMLLTKESGIVLPVVLIGWEMIEWIFFKHSSWKTMLRRLLPVCLSLAVALSFFLVQRLRFGWFFLPLYTDFLKSFWHEAAHNIPDAAAYLFLYGGRNGISILMLLALIYVFFLKRAQFDGKQRQVLGMLAVFMCCYWLFCGVNYYIPRYMLCAVPPFIIAAVAMVDKMLSKLMPVCWVAITALAVNCLYFYSHPGNSGDKDYSPSVTAAKEIIMYCESNGLNGHHIYTTSLLRDAMTNPYSGYLSGMPFKGLHWQFFPDTEYCLFSSDEYNDAPVAEIKRTYKLELVKRVREGYSWCELYSVIR